MLELHASGLDLGLLLTVRAPTEAALKPYGHDGLPRLQCHKSLAAIASVGWMAIVHRPDVHRRWRYINRRRWWRVIDRRWRGDIHRLRCECAAYESSDTKPYDSSANGRTIACLGRSRE